MTRLGDQANQLFKDLTPFHDLDLHPQEVKGDVGLLELGKPNEVLLRRHHAMQVPADATLHKLMDVLAREPVVIGES